jgi:hypothetical protein
MKHIGCSTTVVEIRTTNSEFKRDYLSNNDISTKINNAFVYISTMFVHVNSKM